MNEIGHITSPPPAGEPAYKDRSTGLLVFGILTLILGCFVALLVPLVIFGQVMAAQAPNAPQTNNAAILPAVALYGILAAVLVWLGVGSIKARRWARALLLIFSWSWLVLGVSITVFLPFIMSRVFANRPPDRTGSDPTMRSATIVVMIAFTVLFFGFFFVVLPALWAFFYGSRHVKATCEARDPVTRWTDACPLPVLGISLWTWMAVPIMLLLPLTGRAVFPFFGTFISGPATDLFCLFIAAVYGIGGWWLYRVDIRGWWLILSAIVIFLVSGILTYTQHDIMEMYQLQGLPQARIDHIQKMGLFTGNRMVWMSALSSMPLIGYLLFVKRYLRKSENLPTDQQELGSN